MILPAPRNLTVPEMIKQAEALRRRAASIDAMVARYEEGKADALSEAAEQEERKREREERLWFLSLAEESQEYPVDKDGNIVF